MSQCEITIEFDRPDRRYRGGEVIAGVVNLYFKESVKYRAITLNSWWGTQGPKKAHRWGPRQYPLDGDRQVGAGDTRRLPFSFLALREPLTCSGKKAVIEHFLSVEVSVPWAKNPEHREAYILVPGRPPAGIAAEWSKVADAEGTLGLGYRLFITLVVLSQGAFLFAYSSRSFSYAFFAVVGWYWIRRALLRSKLDEVVLTMPSRVLVAGEDCVVTVSITPRQSCSIDGIRLRFKCSERRLSFGDFETDSQFIIRPVVESPPICEPGVVLTAGQTFTREISLTAPTSEAYSFSTEWVAFEWVIDVQLDTPNHPDWKDSIPFRLVPPEFLESSSTEG
jgi:hypothetical protein